MGLFYVALRFQCRASWVPCLARVFSLGCLLLVGVWVNLHGGGLPSRALRESLFCPMFWRFPEWFTALRP